MNYVVKRNTNKIPRLPLVGSLDLTYRCNNNCLHCWISIRTDSEKKAEELSSDDIKQIAAEARRLGCRTWEISGGEPMLRPDFPEIFSFLTENTDTYTLNTNGTFIDQKIARILKKKGKKLVSLYGADAEVHDRITRNPGSFEAVLQGMSYLREAGAGFIVQIVPMKDNFHQLEAMARLAASLSPYWRYGAAWLYLSADGDPKRNKEIDRQRLTPKQVVRLDKPDLSDRLRTETESRQNREDIKPKGLFSACIQRMNTFHIDPYGRMSFCGFIKDSSLRYNLRKGSFKEGWEEFLPSLSDRIQGGKEFEENCGSCLMRTACRWCPAYGYLEHGRFTAKIDYLCDIAREEQRFKAEWLKNHRRYYKTGGITLQVEADLPITDSTFHSRFKEFEVDNPGEDTVVIRHHFLLPVMKKEDFGEEVYRKSPWAIYKKNNSWIYVGIGIDPDDDDFRQIAVFSQDHTDSRIYNKSDEYFRKGGNHSLTLFPTDQILLARLLADRQGCYLHSSGVVLDRKGLLFVGHSDAGKSTITTLLQDEVKILCDDRIIVRKLDDGFRIYGTWSHGDVATVSQEDAPLHGLFFLNKSPNNRLERVEDPRISLKNVLACLIKPFVSTVWWEKTLVFVDNLVREAPCYNLEFDKSGKVMELMKKFCALKERPGRLEL